MISYFVLRYLTPVFLMIGWVFYQLAIEKKTWKHVQDDALACCVFVVVWILIAYFISG